MSGQRDKPFIHPFNFFIVNVGVEQTHANMISGAIGKNQALKSLLWFLAWFERDIKEKLDNEIKFLKLRVQLSSEEKEMWDIISKIANALHDAGYFTQAKMRPPTRESGMKDIQITVDRAKYAKDRENPS